MDMQESASKLKVDPSSSISHHTKIKYLVDIQAELLREEVRIRENLINIQNMVLPVMDTMQKHIVHCKSLIQEQNFSVANHLIQLSPDVQIALSTCQILQQTWDNSYSTILKVHHEFLSHFGVTIQSVYFILWHYCEKGGEIQHHEMRRDISISERGSGHSIESTCIYVHKYPCHM